MKVVIVRYSEIHLKGNNRSFFENALLANLKYNLYGISCKVSRLSARYVISDFEDNDTEKIVDAVKNTFGVYSLSVAEETDTDLDAIAALCLRQTEGKSGTFKVVTNRADKRFPMNSMQISAEIGGRILDANDALTVSLQEPQHVVYIDIRETGKTFVFSEIIKGVNGMPVGTGGKGMVMLSGGIDSPVATYMMAKRGMSLCAVHFHSFPYTSEQAKEKVLSLAKIVKKFTLKMTVYVVRFTDIQLAIHENCPEEFMITIMRRFMMRIAERLAVQHGCGAVITGESLGQVASQTLESLTSTNSVATLPVLRPLIAFDKDEIVDIAKKIGTFETSILPYEDCCTVFLPKNPVTKPKLDTVQRLESALDVEALTESALQSVETVVIQ